MKITLESTTKIVRLNGIEARVWEGHTESGIPVFAYVARVAVPIEAKAECERFERELFECKEPSPVVAAIPRNLVLEELDWIENDVSHEDRP